MGGPPRRLGSKQETMKKLLSNTVVNHFLAQTAVGAGLALLTYLAGADYSALGAWGGVIQAGTAVALSTVHKATGLS